jgi:hypothetical protein
MSGTTDTSEITDVRSRRAFLDREILRRSQTLEMELEFASNLSSSEMRVVCGPFFPMRFGGIFLLAFLSSSSVAAFCGPNSDSRNGVRFAASRQASEIIAPEAPHSPSVFPSIRQDACPVTRQIRT